MPTPTTQLKNIVLVHGAFADGSCWLKIIPLLLAKGFKVSVVQNPLSSLADDVTAVNRVLSEQDGPVLLVGHSWGGAVITESGNDPKVVGLVYVAAGAPDSGQSFGDWWKNYPPAPGAAQIQPYGKDGFVALTPVGIKDCFAQDVPTEESALIGVLQVPIAGRCFDDKVSTAAWRSKPSWYVVAANDRTIPTAVQVDSAKRMNSKTLTLQSSHVPMISQPDKVANFIVEAAETLASR